MLKSNQLQEELVRTGWAEAPKPKRKRAGKQFKCKTCGATMVNPDWGNFMYCPKCEKKASYFIFTESRD